LVLPAIDMASVPRAGETLPLPAVDMASLQLVAETLPMPAIDLASLEPEAGPRAPAPAPGSADRAGLAGVARGGVLNLGGAAVAAVCSVGLTAVVTRNFAKPAVGAFFVAMSLFLIVEAVASLGAYNGAIYFIARLRALKAERRIPAIMRAAIVPVVVSSLLGTAAMLVFAGSLSRLLLAGGASVGVSPDDVARALRALAAALPFAALSDTLLGAARGYRDMRPTVLVDRIGRSSLQVLGVLAAAFVGSAALLAPLWALPYVPASIAAYFWLRAIVRRQRKRLKLADSANPSSAPSAEDPADNRHGRPNAKGFWSFTAPRSLATIAQIVIQRLDIVLVGIMKGPVAAAIYTAATRFLVAGQLGNSALANAAQPQLTHLFTVRDRRGANAVYQVTTAWLILLTWPIYLLAVIFGPSVLSIFGHSYRAGSTVMVILGLTMLVAAACGQVDVVLITTGRSTWSLMNGLLAMLVNIGVDLVLIPRLGITGAAVGWSAAILVSNLVPLVQVAVAAQVHPFGRGTAIAILLTTASFAVIPLGLRAVAGHAPWVPLAGIGAGCVVMAIGLWRLREHLHLAVMPGIAALRRSRRADAAAGPGSAGDRPLLVR
jgi:O-antigen/teichoic acid export membrane protein